MARHASVGMSHHLADHFEGYTVCDGNGGGEGESDGMGTDVLVDSAKFGDLFEVSICGR